jgi:hypothetical protein
MRIAVQRPTRWARILSVVALAAVAGAGSAAARAEQQTCVLQQIGELPVAVTASRATLSAKVNGSPVRMIVDTGSGDTTLFTSAVQKLGLTPGTVEGLGRGGGAEPVVDVSLDAAGMTSPRFTMFVAGRRPGDVDGLIGAAFLLQSDVEFDLPEGKIRFFRPKGCKGDQVVYWRKAYAVAPMLDDPASAALVVPVEVNGVPLRAAMDTGAARSALTAGASSRVGVTAAGMAYGGDGDAGSTGVGTFQSFGFGDETIHNAQLRIADSQSHLGSLFANKPVTPPDMLLGLDFFRAHRVYVAVSQHRVYVSYEGGQVFQTSAPAAWNDNPLP